MGFSRQEYWSGLSFPSVNQTSSGRPHQVCHIGGGCTTESNSPVGAELQNSREVITVCSPASGKVLPGPRGASSPQNIDGFSRVKQQRPPPAFPSPLPCATRLQHDISRAGGSTPRSPGWWLRGGERRQNICGGPSWVRTHRPLLLRTRLLLSAGRGPRLPGPAKIAFEQVETPREQPQEKS